MRSGVRMGGVRETGVMRGSGGVRGLVRSGVRRDEGDW